MTKLIIAEFYVLLDGAVLKHIPHPSDQQTQADYQLNQPPKKNPIQKEKFMC
jgi:hypothetical protein